MQSYKKKAVIQQLAAAGLASQLLLVTQAVAVEFDIGPISARLDNNISYGLGWRTEEPDGRQIAQFGTPDDVNGTGSSFNADDGNLNYDKGDLFTHVIKSNHDFELIWENYGAFMRAKAYYDTVIMDGDPNFVEYNDETRDAAGAGAEVLDAYLWSDFSILERPATVRIGKQVVNWGESIFIQGGINSINPVDVAAFRKPGAEIKEGLLPVNMLYGNFIITDSLSVEAFYQLEWEATRIDPCGTFFSTIDLVADGCAPVFLSGDQGQQAILDARDEEIAAGVPLDSRGAPIVERLTDSNAKDSGQYGMAFRYFSSALGDAELTFYYMNLHSRVPVINGFVNNTSQFDGSPVNEDRTESVFPQYRIVHPEDITIWGLGFNRTTESGISLSAEISLKEDLPVSWNAFELLVGGLALDSSLLFQNLLEEAMSADPTLTEEEALVSLKGTEQEGFERFDVIQAQGSALFFFDQPRFTGGADRLSLIVEAGAVYIQGLPELDEARFGRSNAFGLGSSVDPETGIDQCVEGFVIDGQPTGTAANVNPVNCNNDGYTDQFSWGYRVRATFDYPNAIAGINLSPEFALAHDVSGNSYEPGGPFVDGRITTSYGLKADYLSRYNGSIVYTNFVGGGRYNLQNDRDNITLSVGFSF